MTYRLSGRLLNKGLMGAVAALLLLMSLLAPARAELVQFVYTSDQHYGITRKAFRGLDKVSSREVNAAMVQAINTLPGISLPEDGGVRAGQPVQWADAVISTGDIANRMDRRAPDPLGHGVLGPVREAVYQRRFAQGPCGEGG